MHHVSCMHTLIIALNSLLCSDGSCRIGKHWPHDPATAFQHGTVDTHMTGFEEQSPQTASRAMHSSSLQPSTSPLSRSSVGVAGEKHSGIDLGDRSLPAMHITSDRRSAQHQYLSSASQPADRRTTPHRRSDTAPPPQLLHSTPLTGTTEPPSALTTDLSLPSTMGDDAADDASSQEFVSRVSFHESSPSPRERLERLKQDVQQQQQRRTPSPSASAVAGHNRPYQHSAIPIPVSEHVTVRDRTRAAWQATPARTPPSLSDAQESSVSSPRQSHIAGSNAGATSHGGSFLHPNDIIVMSSSLSSAGASPVHMSSLTRSPVHGETGKLCDIISPTVFPRLIDPVFCFLKRVGPPVSYLGMVHYLSTVHYIFIGTSLEMVDF